VNELFGDVKVEKEVESRRAEWLRKFRRGFVYNFGQHMLICGITGSGKTQTMFWLVDEIRKAEENGRKRQETIVWFDTGKSDFISRSTEFLVLKRFGNLNVLIPEGCDIKFEKDHGDAVKVQHFSIDNLWNKIERRRINVVCLEPFLRDEELHGQIFTKIFDDLIMKAHNLELKPPMALFFDEFHNLCPPTEQDALSRSHYRLGKRIQKNIERLRSLGIRFICSTHGMTKIRKGVRMSFQWRIIKRYIGDFGREDNRLNDFTGFFRKLENWECVIVYPNGIFSDVLSLPFYPYNEEDGYAFYQGMITEKFIKVYSEPINNKELVTNKQFIAVNLRKGYLLFEFSSPLIKKLDELGITENRVSVRLLPINSSIPIKFIFDENGKYGFTEYGRIHCMEFFREYNLIGVIKGRSFKVEINPEEKSVTAYWKPLKPLS